MAQLKTPGNENLGAGVLHDADGHCFICVYLIYLADCSCSSARWAQMLIARSEQNESTESKPSDPSVSSVHFSSATVEWEIPRAPFDELSWIYGGFTLDPCATRENAKCSRFFTHEDDGLAQQWDGKVFLNPPYGRETGRWVRKTYEGSLRGALIVCLLPARTDTRWWQDYARRGRVCFLRGRLKFGDARNAAPFPSAIVTFGRYFSL